MPIRTMLSAPMFTSSVAMDCATEASVPGSFSALIKSRAMKRDLFASSRSQRTSIQRSGSSSKPLQCRRLDRVDGDALPLLHYALDAIARYGSSRAENGPRHCQIGRGSAMGSGPSSSSAAPSSSKAERDLPGILKIIPGCAAHIEPAVIAGHLHGHTLILIIGEDRPQNIERRHLPSADSCNRVFHVLLGKRCSTGLQCLPRKGLARTLECSFKDAVAQTRILLADRHRVARRMAERALPVTTTSSHAAGGTWTRIG